MNKYINRLTEAFGERKPPSRWLIPQNFYYWYYFVEMISIPFRMEKVRSLRTIDANI